MDVTKRVSLEDLEQILMFYALNPSDDDADIAIALLESAYGLTSRDQAKNLTMRAIEVARDLPRITPIIDIDPPDTDMSDLDGTQWDQRKQK